MESPPFLASSPTEDHRAEPWLRSHFFGAVAEQLGRVGSVAVDADAAAAVHEGVEAFLSLCGALSRERRAASGQAVLR